MTDWYYSDHHNSRLGPVRAQDLADLHANGQLAADTLVWRDGYADWRPWREAMPEVLGDRPLLPAGMDVATSPAAGDTSYDVVGRSPASPYAAPRAQAQQWSDYVGGGEVVYAGFWKRYAALFIDGFLVTIAFYAVLLVGFMIFGIGVMSSLQAGDGDASLGILLMFGLYIAYPLISGAYYVFMESSGHQATLGKMAVGIKVTDVNGQRLTRGRAFGRWASHLVCYFTLYIGYVVAAFTERKQGLHDMVASTLVVDRHAFTAHPDRQRRELGVVTIVVLCLSALFVLGYIALIAVGIAAGVAGLGQN